MKVLVPVKRVVDYRVNVRVKRDGSGVDIDNAKKSINPFDEIALEEALRLKEQGIATEVIVVSVGEAAVQETLRHGLALGADRAIWVNEDKANEPIHIAKILKAIAREECVDLILMGKQAIDNDCQQTGQMCAALLDWPQATCASNIEIDQNRQATVTSEIDGGLETTTMMLPALITTDLRLNDPRLATLPNIMKSKSKPMTTLTLNDCQVVIRKHTNIASYAPPPDRKKGIMLDSIDALITTLKEKL